VVTARQQAISDDAEFVSLAWLRDGKWREHTVPRGCVAEARRIVELAEKGAPITSVTARDAVEYLAAFEVANREAMRPRYVADHFGWQGDDALHGFLWGTKCLCSEGSESAADPIIFRGADEGDEQLALALQPQGDFTAWKAAVARLEEYPRARLAMYTGFCPPLVRILGAPNFTVSFAGSTSQGKTTVLRVAASLWGGPDERQAGSLVGTWDATRVWIERAASVFNDLPLLLDDTKRARWREDVAQTLYDVSSGRARGRGSITGMRSTSTFRTVLISSGEESIVSFTQDGGTRARVLELWGSPFGATDAATAQLVNRVNEGVLDNYGHAGPAFVRFLLMHRDKWPAWREHFRRLRRRYERRAGDNSVAARMASHLAVIRMAAVLAHRAGLLPWGYRDVTRRLWGELTAETHEADRAAAALRYVMSWASGHIEEFHRPGFGNDRLGYPRDAAGRWNLDERTVDPSDRYVGFLPHKLDAVLAEGGFQADAIVRQWADRRWLLTSPGRGRRYRARLGTAGATDLVAISAAAIEEVCGPFDGSAEVHPTPRLLPLEGQARAAARRLGFQHRNGTGTHTGTP